MNPFEACVGVGRTAAEIAIDEAGQIEIAGGGPTGGVVPEGAGASRAEIEHRVRRVCDFDPIERAADGRPFGVESVDSIAGEARLIEAERSANGRQAKIDEASSLEILMEKSVALND